MVDGMKCWEEVMDKYKQYFTAAEELKATDGGGKSDDLEKLRLDIITTIDQFLQIAKSSEDSPNGSMAITLDELHASNIANSDDDDDSDCCDCDCGCDD